MLRVRPARAHGFTLVELLITMALVAFLAMLAVPAMSEWVRGTRVQTGAEALQNGMRLAQNEAIRRGRMVVFSFTNATPAKNVQAVANGLNWSIQTRPIDSDKAGGGDGIEFIGGSPEKDAMAGLAINTRGITALCFSPSGGLNQTLTTPGPAGADCSLNTAPVAAFDVSLAKNPDSTKTMRVLASVGGRVRMCNPDFLVANRPDGC